MDTGTRYELVSGRWAGAAGQSWSRPPSLRGQVPVSPPLVEPGGARRSSASDHTCAADTGHWLRQLRGGQAVSGQGHRRAGGSQIHRAGREGAPQGGVWGVGGAMAARGEGGRGGAGTAAGGGRETALPDVPTLAYLPPPLRLQIDKNVEREIINHRMLSGHPNIVRFREVRCEAAGGGGMMRGSVAPHDGAARSNARPHPHARRCSSPAPIWA